LARVEPLRALMQAGQLLTSLSLMTPAHVARKRFAGDFDLDAHLAQRRRMIEEGARRAGSTSVPLRSRKAARGGRQSMPSTPSAAARSSRW